MSAANNPADPEAGPEEFEGLSDEVAIRFVRTMSESATRQHVHIDEFQEAVNGHVGSSGRDAWEQRKADE